MGRAFVFLLRITSSWGLKESPVVNLSVCSLLSCCCLSLCIIHQSAPALYGLTLWLGAAPPVLIAKRSDRNPASDPPFPSVSQRCCPELMNWPFKQLMWHGLIRTHIPVSQRAGLLLVTLLLIVTEEVVSKKQRHCWVACGVLAGYHNSATGPALETSDSLGY